LLIIGCGNSDRGDDAAGALAAEELKSRGYPATTHSGEATGLLDLMTGHEEVILVDAMITGMRPGSVLVFDGRHLPNAVRRGRHSTHGLGLIEALDLGKALDRLPAKVTVYGIEAESFDRPAPSRASVLGAKHAVKQIVRQIASRSRFRARQ
jgi:hydrogenase maturation protease